MWELDHREGGTRKMISNCGAGEDSWESLGQWGDQTSEWILKEINPEYSLEGLLLKLKLQCFGYLMWRAHSLEKTLKLGKIEGRRRRGCTGWDGWMASSTQWTWVWANSKRQWVTGKPSVLRFMGSQTVRHDFTTEQQSPFPGWKLCWTTLASLFSVTFPAQD